MKRWPHSQCISEITDCEKCGSTNVYKVTFDRNLRQTTCQTGPNTVQIWTTEPLAYLLINVKVIQLKKISLKYSLLNKDNLKHPIQMELSLKRKTFLKFLKARLNFQNFQKKKNDRHSWFISELTDSEKCGSINV